MQGRAIQGRGPLEALRSVLPAALQALLAELDTHAERIAGSVLAAALRGLDVGCAELLPFAAFDSARYRRNALPPGPAYEVLLVCWRAGQRSPIHDHLGSECAFRVLGGIATETAFARSACGLVYPTRTRPLRAGSIGAVRDSQIHQVSNLQEREDLVTLHLYSPPLSSMRTYSLTEPRVETWVPALHEFEAGAGI